MENGQDLGYYARFVAEELKISRDTLRSWSLKLETQGIEFERNPRGDRIYYQKDIHALKHMHELLGLQQPMNSVLSIVSEKMLKDDYSKAQREDNEEKTLSVIRTKNGHLTDEKRLIEFKSEIVNDLRDAVREEFKESLKQEIKDAVKEVIIEEREAMAKEITNSVMTQLNDQRLALPELESEKDQEIKQMAAQAASDLLEKIERKRIENEEEAEKVGFFSRLFNKKKK